MAYPRCRVGGGWPQSQGCDPRCSPSIVNESATVVPITRPALVRRSIDNFEGALLSLSIKIHSQEKNKPNCITESRTAAIFMVLQVAGDTLSFLIAIVKRAMHSTLLVRSLSFKKTRGGRESIAEDTATNDLVRHDRLRHHRVPTHVESPSCGVANAVPGSVRSSLVLERGVRLRGRF